MLRQQGTLIILPNRSEGLTFAGYLQFSHLLYACLNMTFSFLDVRCFT